MASKGVSLETSSFTWTSFENHEGYCLTKMIGINAKTEAIDNDVITATAIENFVLLG